MKTIKVQKDCIVDRKNIAKVKQREIALSVTSVDSLNGNENGFINFKLGIDDCQLCYESFGTYLLKEKKAGFVLCRVIKNVNFVNDISYFTVLFGKWPLQA